MGNRLWAWLAALTTVIAFVVAGMWSIPPGRAGTWLLVLAALTASFACLGMATLGRPAAVLIDDRNMYSLSRLQVALWSLLILSAYLTAAMSNVMGAAPAAAESAADPLVIAIPTAIWVLLGINVTAWIGSPMILGTKKQQEPARPVEAARTIQTLNAAAGASLPIPAASPARAGGITPVEPATTPEPLPVFTNDGKILTKRSPLDAGVADFFRGEETGNGTKLDLGKIQLFYFTLIVAVVYGVGLFLRFGQDGPIRAFPDLDSSIVALLGISNAGYLTSKAVPHD